MINGSDLILLGLAFLIGFINDANGPKEYHYQNHIVVVYKKYQCPKNCEVNHYHYVYYNSVTDGLVIDKDKVGKRYKRK